MLHRIRRRKRRRWVLFGLLAVVLLLFSSGMFLVKSLYDDQFARFDARDMTGRLAYSDVADQDPRQVVQFLSGGNQLTGYIYGEQNSKGLVVIAHGLGGGAEDYLPQALYFVDRGWQVFAYDCTGSHASEGTGTMGLPQSALDLDAALTYIETHHTLRDLPIMLLGHSWGGYAVAAILDNDHEIKAAVTVAGFNAPTTMAVEQAVGLIGPLGYAAHPFIWAYQRLLFGRAAAATAVRGINSTKTPVMIVHGVEDDTISYGGASIIARRDDVTNPNVIFKTLSDTKHSGHGNMFWSEAALSYVQAQNAEFKTLYNTYAGDMPHDIRARFYDGIDRYQTSELNSEFMDEIETFFERSL